MTRSDPQTRRAFLRNASLAALALGLGPTALRAQSGRAPKLVPLRGGVGIFSGQGGTIGWLVDPAGGVAVVDSQFPPTAGVCLGQLRTKAGKPTGICIDTLINTHHHGDHTGGNGKLRPATRQIVAHANVPALQTIQAEQRKSGKPTLPDATFATDWKHTLGKETIRAHHHGPAHTKGDIAVAFEQANVVHMGDLVFNEIHPFIDDGSGASVRGWISVLEAIVKQHDKETIYVFGHGRTRPTGGQADVLKMRDYFSALIGHVEAGRKAGQTRAQICALTALKGFESYASFGQRLTLARNLGVTYDELSAPAKK